MNPKARSEELLIEEVAGELVVYDCQSQQAHRLNATAAFVWRHCDGQHSIAELVELVATEFTAAASDAAVRLAIELLQQAGLLENTQPQPADAFDTSRRKALQKLSLTGALTVIAPIVATLAAPTPAQAGSGNWGGGAGHGGWGQGGQGSGGQGSGGQGSGGQGSGGQGSGGQGSGGQS